jgi:4-hydroxyphenylpyruvate dioxygenase-like putative hemolysin
MAAALIVHVDADPQNTVADRHTQLGAALQQAGQLPRGATEHISHIVPKRNIETWIYFYLNGPPVDEATEYAKYPGNESACWPAAEKFSDDAVQNVMPLGAPASLVQGLQEFKRAL